MAKLYDRLRGVFATDGRPESDDEMGAMDDDSREDVDRGREPVPGDPTSATPPPASQPIGVPFRPDDPRWPDVWGHRASWDDPGGTLRWVEAFLD
jgi:hypothetical protein